MDLFLQNKIILTKNKIEIIDSNSTGDEYLDQILSFIKNSRVCFMLEIRRVT